MPMSSGRGRLSKRLRPFLHDIAPMVVHFRRTRYFMALLRALLVAFGIVSLARGAELSTLDGKRHVGDLVSIDAKELVFRTKESNQAFEITKIDCIDVHKEEAINPKVIEVELLDGAHFRCSDFKVRGSTVVLTLDGSKRLVEFPAALMLFMVRDISDPKLNQAFRAILAKRGKRDMWIVRKPDQSLDVIQGTFGDGDAKGESIGFELEANAEKLNVQFTKVFGMIFNPQPISAAQTICKVIDTRKNVIYAKSFTFGADKSFIVESITGVKVAYPGIESIYKLDFSAGSVLYLSNAEPIKVEHTSTEGQPEPYRRDRNLDNDALIVKDKDAMGKDIQRKFAKGLALHSRTVLTYDLGGKFKQFQAIAGVDECVEGDSKVTLTIEADFKPVFKQVIKKGDDLKPINLAILNVKQLRITVESDLFDLGNQVDLLDAKVLR
jgi:hypothetical protein